MSGGHSAGVTTCSVSPDGAFFVSASRDHALKLWDAETGEEIRTLTGSPGEVWFCAVGPDGLVYSAGPSSAFDAIVKVWDPGTGDEVAAWDLQDVGEIKGLVVSPAATYVATLRSYGYIDFHDPKTGEKLGQLDAGSAITEALIMASDGSSMLVGCQEGLHAIDPVEGKVINAFPDAHHRVRQFEMMPDGKAVFFETGDGWAIGEIASGTSRTMAEGDLFSSCAISPDGSLVAACCGSATETWNSITGSQRTVEAASIRICRTDSGDLVHEFDLKKEEATVCALSPDGSLVLGAGAGALRILDVETGEELGSIPLDAEPTCLSLHPSLPVVALGDAAGGFHVLDLGGIELGPIVVTAEDRGAGPEVRCPACNTSSPAESAWLGTKVECPSCGTGWRVNPFVLTLRPEPPPLAGAQPPSEEESTRFKQALNRAVFTATSPEEHVALSQRLEQRTAGGRPGSGDPSALEASRAAGAEVEPPQRIASKEQLAAMLVDEVVEAGIGPDALSGPRGDQFLVAVMSAAVLALTGKTAHLLTEGQRAELMKVATETVDPLEAVRFLHETLPDFGVPDAFPAELKVACRQQAEKLEIVRDAPHAPTAPRQSVPETPPQLTPLNEEIKAMIRDETAEAGIDLDEFPPELRGRILAGALSQAIMDVIDGALDHLDASQKERLFELRDGETPSNVVQFLHEDVPDLDVLGALREGLRSALPRVASPGGRGKLQLAMGNQDEAIALLEEQEDLSRKTGDAVGLAEAMGDRALILTARGDLPAALSLHEEEERICRESGDRAGLSRSLGKHGLCLRAVGRDDEAMRRFKELETLSRELRDPKGLARALGNQAELLGNRGEVETALGMLGEAAQQSRDVGDWEQLASSLAGRGVFMVQAGRAADALGTMEEAHRVAADHGLTQLAQQIEPFLSTTTGGAPQAPGAPLVAGSFAQLVDATIALGRARFERQPDGLVLRVRGRRAKEVIARVRELTGDAISVEATLPPLPRRRKARKALLLLNQITANSGVKALLRDGIPGLAIEFPASLFTPQMVAGFAEGLAALADTRSEDLGDADAWNERLGPWFDVLGATLPALDLAATTEQIRGMLNAAEADIEVDEEGHLVAEIGSGDGRMRISILIRPESIALVNAPRMVFQLDEELKDEKYLSGLLRANADVPVARIGIDGNPTEVMVYSVPGVTPDLLEQGRVQLLTLMVRQMSGR